MSIEKKASERLASYRRHREVEIRKRRSHLQELAPEYFALEKSRTQLGILMVKARLGAEDLPVEDRARDFRKEIQAIEERMSQILEEHSLDGDYLDPGYHCEICRDQGTVNGRVCQCKKQIILSLRYALSELEDRLQKENFEHYDLDLFEGKQRDLMALYKKEMTTYARNFHPGSENYLFYGDVGTGKTFLSSSIAKIVLERGYTVIYKTATSLMKELFDFYYSDFKQRDRAQERYEEILQADLLIIDDLGTEHKTDSTLSHLFNLINERLLRQKTMILSTNLRLKDIEDYYDERIYSRIIGNFQARPFLGEDIRRKNLEK